MAVRIRQLSENSLTLAGAKWRGIQAEAARAGSGGRKGWSMNDQGGCGAFQSLTAHRSHAWTPLRHAVGPTIMSTMLKTNPPQKIAARGGEGDQWLAAPGPPHPNPGLMKRSMLLREFFLREFVWR